jgi:hypothetical protein
LSCYCTWLCNSATGCVSPRPLFRYTRRLWTSLMNLHACHIIEASCVCIVHVSMLSVSEKLRSQTNLQLLCITHRMCITAVVCPNLQLMCITHWIIVYTPQGGHSREVVNRSIFHRMRLCHRHARGSQSSGHVSASSVRLS